MTFFASGGNVAVDGITIQLNAAGEAYVAEEDLLVTTLANEHEIEIIELQAATSTTPLDHDDTISDTFSDADGFSDTVDTGNTTATFSTNKYIRPNAAPTAQAGETTLPASLTRNYRTGETFTVGGSAIYLINVTKHSGCDATTCEVFLKSTEVSQGTATFSGDVATFASPLSLSSSTQYIVVCWNGAATNYTMRSIDGTYSSYDVVRSLLTYDGYATYSGSWAYGTNHWMNVISLGASTTIGATKKIIQCDLPTISGTVSHTELIVNDPDRETGDSIEYDLVDASANTEVDQAIDVKNTKGALVTNPTILKINLNPGTAETAGVPSCRTYSLKLWKSL